VQHIRRAPQSHRRLVGVAVQLPPQSHIYPPLSQRKEEGIVNHLRLRQAYANRPNSPAANSVSVPGSGEVVRLRTTLSISV
jgi:hypothetical protein